MPTKRILEKALDMLIDTACDRDFCHDNCPADICDHRYVPDNTVCKATLISAAERAITGNEQKR